MIGTVFDQKKLDRSVLQSRGIFNKYVYETNDTIATVQTTGYFLESRFALIDGDLTNGMGWNGGIIECQCSDGYFIGRINGSTGTLLDPSLGNSLSGSSGIAQVSVTHPSPPVLVAVTGTGDPDLNPANGGYVPVLNEYTEQLVEGSGITVLPDGRFEFLRDATVLVNAYADISHSANNSTASATFVLYRGPATVFSSRAVHARLPSQGDIGNLSWAGSLNVLAGDRLGVAFASDVTGNVSIRASSVIAQILPL